MFDAIDVNKAQIVQVLFKTEHQWPFGNGYELDERGHTTTKYHAARS